MAKNPSTDSHEFLQNEDSLQWDQSSQLYYHANSGFYHDPNAQWYYSSRDGLYYKFQDGNYVLLEYQKDDGVEGYQCGGVGCGEVGKCGSDVDAVEGNAIEVERCSRMMSGEHVLAEQSQNEGSMQEPENPPPVSEWLEDTLINLYLSGYSNLETDATDTSRTNMETGYEDNLEISALVRDCNQDQEGNNFQDRSTSLADTDGNLVTEDISWEEENWRAQYGQVVKSGDELMLDSSVMDLWDWALVTGFKKDGKAHVTRLVGQLVRPSTKLHPSIASGRILKTAPVCQTHLDLVRVATGQIYRLRSPSAKYLASLSAYDSSNPTKEWGFPELNPEQKEQPLAKFRGKNQWETTDEAPVIDETMLPAQHTDSKKHKSNCYRDRAAERRKLHGGYGLGPGQKGTVRGEPTVSSTTTAEEAQAEALEMSFGAGSYARKLLENMGWKEGEALGKTTNGIVEPIEAVGNIGSAGLGFPQKRRHR